MNFYRIHKKQKSLKSLLLVLTLALLTSCASKKLEPPPQNPYLPPSQTPATMKNTYPPMDPTQSLPNSEMVPGGSTITMPPPDVHPGSPRIALVVGGAGVASYATVGLLKRFHEEGIRLDMIVATGWPALFSVGFGFLRSVHDLEWFAMRLQSKDFESLARLLPGSDPGLYDKISPLILDTFRHRDLSETHLPVYLMTGNTDLGEVGAFDRGDWKVPLLETMSIPGIYRPFRDDDQDAYRRVEAMGVDEAVRRHADVIIGVGMYTDYVDSVIFSGAKEGADAGRIYGRTVQSNVNEQLRNATFTSRIALGRSPTDFGYKRQALVAGYREGTRLAREIRKLLHR